jgi:hypothetical protein
VKLIALTGLPGSGKTALAKELQKLNYLLVDFTGMLKLLAYDALCCPALLPDLTLADLEEKKDFYRPFLIEFGKVIGFDANSEFIEDALGDWHMYGEPNAVFDNIRTDQQAKYLKALGWKVIRLSSCHSYKGGEEILRGLQLREVKPDLEINRDYYSSPRDLADYLMHYDEDLLTVS